MSELKNVEHTQFDNQVKNDQTQLNNFGGGWPYPNTSSMYFAFMENHIKDYQISRGIPITGLIDERTSYCLANERYSIITTATPYSKIFLEPKPGNGIITGTKQAYDIISQAVGNTQLVIENIDKSEGGLAYILDEWEKVIVKQKHRLNKCLNKMPVKSKSITKYLEKCEQFFNEARRYGINTASKVFANNLTKESGIKYIKEVCEAISGSLLTKSLRFMNKSFSSAMKVLKPIAQFLNKIPGLKYLSVIEAIVKGSWALFHFDFEKAFVLYLDGLRLLLEQIIIDATIVTLIAIGGWVALVIAIVIIIIALVVDYFLFNPDPEESWLPTTNLTYQLTPSTLDSYFQTIGEREANKGKWITGPGKS